MHQELPPSNADWKPLLPRTKLGPHRQACFQLEDLQQPTTHVRLTIYPDGGIKRVRLMGRRATPETPRQRSAMPQSASSSASTITGAPSPTPADAPAQVPTIPALPLTAEAFAPYGYVVQAYPNPHHVPKGIKVASANYGTALKCNHLSPISSSVPQAGSLKQTPNFSVYHCQPAGAFGGSSKARFEVKVLERHEYTTQSFVPLGGGSSRYLIVVALPGADGMPDLKTLRAFEAQSSQAFTYKQNVSSNCDLFQHAGKS